MYKNQRRKSFRTNPYNEALPNKRRSLHFVCPLVNEENSDQILENNSSLTQDQPFENNLSLTHDKILKNNSLTIQDQILENKSSLIQDQILENKSSLIQDHVLENKSSLIQDQKNIVKSNNDYLSKNLDSKLNKFSCDSLKNLFDQKPNSFSVNDLKNDKLSQNYIKLSQVTVDTDSELDKLIGDLDDNTLLNQEIEQLKEDDINQNNDNDDLFEPNNVESDNDSLFDDLEDKDDFDEFLISKQNNLDKTLTQKDMNDVFSDNLDENSVNTHLLPDINFKSASGLNIEIKMSKNQQLNLWKKIFGK